MLFTCQIVSISLFRSSITSPLLIYSFSIIMLCVSPSTTYTTIRIAQLFTLQLITASCIICILCSRPAACCNRQGEMLINNNSTYFATFLFIALKYLYSKLTSAFIYLSLFRNKEIKNSSLFIYQLISIILSFLLLLSYFFAIVFLLCL